MGEGVVGITQLTCALERGIPISVCSKASKELKVVYPTNSSYLLNLTQRQYRNKRIDAIASVIIGNLQEVSRGSISDGEQSSVIKAAKVFLKGLKKNESINPSIENLRKELLAARLAISSGVFEANPGFYEFAEKNFLFNYLRHYGHNLEVEKNTNRLIVLAGGKKVCWEEVKANISSPSSIKPAQPWKYGPEGIQNEDMYQWSELKPYKYEDPSKWNHQWILEFCACSDGSARKTGDHSWFRLKTPRGEIFSIGLYRPGKSRTIDNIKFPFRVKKGHLMQPDLSEFYPCKVNSFEVAISEKTFFTIKKVVEEDKKKDDQIFQALGSNCTQYVNKIACLAGIKLPTRVPIWRVIAPPFVKKTIDALKPLVPDIIRKICEIVVSIITNILQVLLGACFVDKSLKGIQVKPHINSLRDIFRPSKATMYHPHTLAREVCQEVKLWRKHEVDKNYSVPPSYLKVQ